LSAETPGSSGRTAVIFAALTVAAVLLILVVGIEGSITPIPGSGLVHSATVVYSAIAPGGQSPYWAVEVSNSGQEPIVGISMVRVVVMGGNQTESISGIQSGPFELVNGSCLPVCPPGTLTGPVSISLPLGSDESASATLSSADAGAAQVFQECGARSSPCVVNVLVTYADGEVGILEAPISSG